MQETNTPSFLDSLPEEMQTPFIQTVSQTLGCRPLPQLPEQGNVIRMIGDQIFAGSSPIRQLKK